MDDGRDSDSSCLSCFIKYRIVISDLQKFLQRRQIQCNILILVCNTIPVTVGLKINAVLAQMTAIEFQHCHILFSLSEIVHQNQKDSFIYVPLRSDC